MQTLETIGHHLNSPLPEEAPVCATLALPNARSSRHMKVYGVSGKTYEFRWREKDRLLVREYRSPADFTREEMDMRKNVRGRYVIVTLLGSVHPVVHAKEAVAALINAGGAVQIPARVNALSEIGVMCDDAIAAIMLPPGEKTSEPPSYVDPESTPPPVVALRQSGWIGEDGQKVIEPKAQEPGTTKPLESGGTYTQEELMKAGLHSVQMIAKSLGINSYGKSRAMLAEEILAKQSGA